MDLENSNQTILTWLQENQVGTNKKGRAVEFKDHGFLMSYLLDESPKIVFKKCTQVGASTETLFKVFYRGDNHSLIVIYSLPTAHEAKDFVWSKVDPLILNSPGLSKKISRKEFQGKPLWSSSVKQIKDSIIFFKGSWTSHSSQSVDSDIVVVDEIDEQKPDIIDQFEERLKGSTSDEIAYYLGNPSIPNFGISARYEQSDQKRFFIRCPHCKRLQTLDWPESINQEKSFYQCKFCHRKLSKETRRVGTWVAKFRDRKVSGYSVSRLMAPWITAEEIVHDYRTKPKKHFYNYVLGEPYLPLEQVVSQENLTNCIDRYDERDFVSDSDDCVIGIDQGDEFHVIIGVASNPVFKVVSAKIAKSVTELEDILNIFKPKLVVMDSLPNKHSALSLQAKYGKDKFLLGNERDHVLVVAEDWLKVDKFRGICHIERTESIDRVMERVQQGRKGIVLPYNLFHLKTLEAHFSNIVPDYQKRFGRVRKVWKKTGKEDFVHALNFALIATEILRPNSNPDNLNVATSEPSRVDKDFEEAVGNVSAQGPVSIKVL